MKIRFLALAVLTLLLIIGCQTDLVNDDDSMELKSSNNVEAMKSTLRKIHMKKPSLNLPKYKAGKDKNSSSSASLQDLMSAINDEFIKQNISLQLDMIEYYGSSEAGNTVYYKDVGNKQLGSDFVPGDPRRNAVIGLDGLPSIFYLTDGVDATTINGLTKADTDGAIRSAMNTWDNVDCTNGLDIVSLGGSTDDGNGFPAFDLGLVQWLVSGEKQGSPWVTDINHSGFVPWIFLDPRLGPGVIGVTFTFSFTDGPGGPLTDIDNNGKRDTALRDIYYNDVNKATGDPLEWTTDDRGNTYPYLDLETVALHEAGHALSQGHFGKAFRNKSGLHFAPRAVMNAGYSGIQRTIDGSDKAGHCSNWAQWPNN